jgi:DNA ligase-1
MTKPMLCKEYDADKPFTPCFIQPKLDGIRCISTFVNGEVILMSRNEKPLHLPHLEDQIRSMFVTLGNTEFFDGELYLHGMSFQDIQSLVKRKGHPLQSQISYHIYDRQLRAPWKDRRFGDRFYDLHWEILKLPNVKKVDTRYVSTVTQANGTHATFVLQGYEGSIYRTNSCLYQEGKRSPDLLKRKDWHEEDFPVIAMREGKGKNKGTAVFECEVDEERYFEVTAPGTYREKLRYWEDREGWIGKLLSVKYQNLTDAGIPRFPIALGFKEDR